MVSISAILIVKNEIKNIERCLCALDFVDEIIVLDSGSNDGTQDVCRKFPKVTLQETDWPGFGPQKNRALALASGEWILSMDADEFITPELHQEILVTIERKHSAAGYEMPILNCYFGKTPHFKKLHTDYPLRLFRKDAGHFTDDMVHEKVLVDGEVGRLHHYFLHNALDSVAEMVHKADLYSTLGAQKLIKPGKKTGVTIGLLHAGWAFIRFYFLKGAFLEGKNGFLLAFGNWLGTFLRYVKAGEK